MKTISLIDLSKEMDMDRAKLVNALKDLDYPAHELWIMTEDQKNDIVPRLKIKILQENAAQTKHKQKQTINKRNPKDWSHLLKGAHSEAKALFNL